MTIWVGECRRLLQTHQLCKVCELGVISVDAWQWKRDWISLVGQRMGPKFRSSSATNCSFSKGGSMSSLMAVETMSVKCYWILMRLLVTVSKHLKMNQPTPTPASCFFMPGVLHPGSRTHFRSGYCKWSAGGGVQHSVVRCVPLRIARSGAMALWCQTVMSRVQGNTINTMARISLLFGISRIGYLARHYLRTSRDEIDQGARVKGVTQTTKKEKLTETDVMFHFFSQVNPSVFNVYAHFRFLIWTLLA